MPWRCTECGASSGDDRRPLYCPRCASMASYVRVVQSPGVAPRGAEPIQASKLAAGVLAPTLGEFDSFLGRLGRPVRIAIFGAAGAGKTTWALRLAQAFRTWGQVLFCAVDEGMESASFRDKIQRLEITSPFIFSGGWPEITAQAVTGRWRMIVVDTVTRAGADPGEMNAYTRAHGVSWVAVLEVTKSGMFRGDASWSHWSDVLIRAEGLRVSIEKNRYGRAGVEKEVACGF